MSIELQRLDCNCNDCKFMQRDIIPVYEAIKRINDERRRVFDIKRKRLLATGDVATEKQAMLMVFQETKKINQGAGHCTKFNKPVDFIPATCQIHTQKCFVHRKD